MNTSSGVLFLHAIPRAFAGELEAVFGRLHIKRKPHQWDVQPLVVGSVKTEIQWSGTTAVVDELVAELAALPSIRFELTSNQTKQQLGQRWSFTPSLGLFAAAVDEVGNLLVNENQVRNALYGTENNLLKLQSTLRKLLGTAWDDELEPFREQKYQPSSTGLIAGWG